MDSRHQRIARAQHFRCPLRRHSAPLPQSLASCDKCSGACTQFAAGSAQGFGLFAIQRQNQGAIFGIVRKDRHRVTAAELGPPIGGNLNEAA